MCAVHIITFSSIHNVTVLSLLIIDSSADTSNSVPRAYHIKWSIGLLDSIVLKDASLSSISAHECGLSISSRSL